MVRLVFLFSFLFILSSHGQEYSPVVAAIPSLLVSYGTVAATPTATATATVAGPELIQQKTATGTGSATITVTMDSPFTVGNVMVVCVSYARFVSNYVTQVTTTTLQTSFDPTPSNPWALVNGTGVNAEIWAQTFSKGGSEGDPDSSIIVTQVETGRISVSVSEWTTFGDTVTKDDSNTNTGLASATVTTGSSVPSVAHNITFAIGTWTADDYSTGPTNGFTRLTQTGSGLVWQEAAYKFQTSATSTSTGWGLSAGINWAAAIVTFEVP